MFDTDQHALIAEAQAHLGDGETVLGAGVFGLQNLTHAQSRGGMLGSLLAPPGLEAVGVAVGGAAAVAASAERQGVSVQVLLAVTANRIYVLNRAPESASRPVVARFDRATAVVAITKMGLSRILHLSEPDTGTSMDLHGSTAWLSSQSGGDKVVLGLLDLAE